MNKEYINHPNYYKDHGIEPIDYIESHELNFNLGNVIKYVSRAGYKDDKIQDLKKAEFYLKREIEKLEKSKTFSQEEVEKNISREKPIITLEKRINDLAKYLEGENNAL